MTAEQALTLATPALVGAIVGVLVNPLIEAWKVRLSRKTWARQERWKLKVSLYERLVVSLNVLERVFEPDYSSSVRYSMPGSEALKRASDARAELRRANASASLWLPEDVVKAVARADRSFDDAGFGEEDFCEDVFTTAAAAKTVLLAAMKKDLMV